MLQVINIIITGNIPVNCKFQLINITCNITEVIPDV